MHVEIEANGFPNTIPRADSVICSKPWLVKFTDISFLGWFFSSAHQIEASHVHYITAFAKKENEIHILAAYHAFECFLYKMDIKSVGESCGWLWGRYE